jgi:beta-1,4-mannosyl-glycoprotein beta-1,4-N-acetylglucosaminyltransferase
MIIDACMFNREYDMLELRLRTLYDAVDYFVIAEADMTHSGTPKHLYLAQNWNRYDRWHDKMIHVSARLSANVDSWTREREHRSALASGIRAVVEDGALVVVGDCDEIPKPEALLSIDKRVGARLELDFYYFNAHTLVKQGWSIGALPWHDDLDPNVIRTLAGYDVPRINNAGWHFSYWMSAEEIRAKLDEFMHHADIAANVPRDEAYIQQCIDAGRDLYKGRGIEFETLTVLRDLPEPLLTEPKFHRWL